MRELLLAKRSGIPCFVVRIGRLEADLEPRVADRMDPLNAHTEEGQPTIPRAPQDFPELANLKRLYVTCDFEAVTTLVLAVGMPNRFRVLTLEGPRRIVVDIAR